MRRYFILNPGAGSGKSAAKFGAVREVFAGTDSEFALTKSLAHAEELARDAAASGDFGAIVAVGGDGTINRALNGFYAADGSRVGGAALALGAIHTGTSPDFSKSHGLPLGAAEAARVVLRGRVKKIEIGRIRFGDGRLRHFACCANIGLGSAIAAGANSGLRRAFGDKAGTFFALLAAVARHRRFSAQINGVALSGLWNISVGKTRFVASGLKINSSRERGEFYVLPVANHVLKTVAALYRGAPCGGVFAAEKVSALGDADVECDGDPAGRLPCEITNAPELDLLC